MAVGNVMQKKITLKSILGKNPGMFLEEIIAASKSTENEGALRLAQIFGRANRGKPKATDKGDYVQFTGEFVGVNLITGERVTSGAAILPQTAENMIHGAMGSLTADGTSETTVEFAIEISAKYEPTAIAKYVFSVRSLIAPKQSDPMKALMVAAGALALENKSDAPKTDTPKGDEAQKTDTPKGKK